MEVLLEIPDVPSTVRSLRFYPALSDKELEEFCQRNDVYRIERTREGVITVVTPTGMQTGGGNANLNGQLYAWWNLHRRGKIFDSNTGFYLPDGSMLSPDASYLTEEVLAQIPNSQRKGIPHACPSFVVELIPETDTVAVSKKKMTRWMTNGVHLGWLVEPRRKRVWVYKAGNTTPEIFSGEYIDGSGPVDGFRLDLKQLWEQYQ